jgi:hypothetical protein
MKKIFIILLWLLVVGFAAGQTKSYINNDGTRRNGWDFGQARIQWDANWLPEGYDRDAVTLRDRNSNNLRSLVVKDLWVTGDDTTQPINLGSIKTLASTITQWNHSYDTTFYSLRASITANASGLISLVDSNVVFRGLIDSSSTLIKQVANDILLQATHLADLDDSLVIQRALIDVNADSIRSKVSTTVFDAMNGRMTTAESNITLNATNILSKVSTTDYNGTTIASLINQTSHSISMSALNIDLTGIVTFTDFDATTQSTINGKTTSSDVTTIIGNTVTTGYINALGITANNVVANMSITSPSITGGTFQTSTTGARMIISGNSIQMYNGNNAFGGIYIDPTTNLINVSDGLVVASLSCPGSHIDALGYTVAGHFLNFSDLAGTVSSSQTNFSTTTAPALANYVTPTYEFGSGGAVLGAPVGWYYVKDDTGTLRKFPGY